MITNPESNSTSKTLNGQPPALFLPGGVPPHKYKIKHIQCLGKEEIGAGESASKSPHLHDIEILNPTNLRKKYPRTYKCWDNMKQRRSKGAIINLAFDLFKDFLRHVGPCEKANYTLDRINNGDPEYAPGKVEWRDKYAQNSNKGNNIFLTHDNGEKRTVAQWAKITKQKASTLYKRHENGWSDMEVITGDRADQRPTLEANPWPYGKIAEWESLYKEAVFSEGYNKQRINFLHEYSKKSCRYYENQKHRLELAIQEKDGFEDDYYEMVFLSYLDNNGYKLDEFKNIESSEIMKQLKSTLQTLGKWRNIYRQTNDLIQYEAKKRQFMDKSSILSKEEILEYFHASCSKPEYTLNLPPQNG